MIRIEEMEKGEGASSHDKEAKGQNTRVGNAETIGRRQVS
jgi:hypothetical protein